VRVVVVGGGVGGLTAARDLTAAGCDVVVVEATDRVGGKLRTHEVAGVAVDVGAEAMLARRPEGVDLVRGLGLDVVHPTSASSRLWTRGALRPLPRSLMGVPMDLAALDESGVLSPEGLARARAEATLPPETPESLAGDVSVGDLVARRLGDEVTDRLVEPLLGGVYAGRARAISARAAVPQLLALAERGSLVEQAAALPSTPGVPVFAGLSGGMGRLPTALAEGLDVRLSCVVTGLSRSVSGFALETGQGRLEADAVIVAAPAPATVRLLATLAPEASRLLAGIEYASVAVVTLAFPAAALAHLGSSSGFLVPPVDGRRIKASTFSFAKWDWVREAGAGEVLHLRASLGRVGEAAALQVADDELVAAALADLAEAAGIEAHPVDTHVQRWGGGLPQYAVGHLDRVARIRAAVAAVPGLELCGAAYDGVGVPAVIASAHAAAARLLESGGAGAE